MAGNPELTELIKRWPLLTSYIAQIQFPEGRTVKRIFMRPCNEALVAPSNLWAITSSMPDENGVSRVATIATCPRTFAAEMSVDFGERGSLRIRQP